MVWEPSARPAGVKDHAPLASAVVVAAMGLPSTVKLTTAFGAAVPLIVALFAMKKSADVPVLNVRFAVSGGTTSAGTGGGVTGTVTTGSVGSVGDTTTGGTLTDVTVCPVVVTVSAAWPSVA